MKTIVWDVDDVLNDLMRAWLETAWKPSHPGCCTSYEALRENPPHVLLGTDLDAYRASLDAFRAGEGRNLVPVPETLAWFERHGDGFRNVALTATPLAAAPAVASWVLTHFGRWIRAFAFIPSPRSGVSLPVYDADKGEWLESLRQVDAMVDDREENLAPARARGIRTIVFPRPWNGAAGRSLSDALDSLRP